MMKTEVAYLVAAGLFAAAAGVQTGSSGSFGISAILLLLAAVMFGWLATRKPRLLR